MLGAQLALETFLHEGLNVPLNRLSTGLLLIPLLKPLTVIRAKLRQNLMHLNKSLELEIRLDPSSRS
jgi:hypothetical protein